MSQNIRNGALECHGLGFANQKLPQHRMFLLEYSLTQRSTATSIDSRIKSDSTTKMNPEKGSRNSKWCLGMSWFGLCASKTVFQPIQTSTRTTSTTTTTITTTTIQTYSDDYYNYH